MRAGQLQDLPDGCVGAIIVEEVLSKSDDLQGDIDEIYRVLSPQGRLYFIEKTRQPAGTVHAKLQTLLSPLYRLLTCGVRLNQPVLEVRRGL